MTKIPDDITIEGNLTVDGIVSSGSSSDGLNIPSLVADPSTLTVGELWYNSVDGIARIYTSAGITNLGGTAAGSLDAAYNGGSNITVDSAAIALTSTLNASAFTIENNTITTGSLVSFTSTSLTTGKIVSITADGLTSGDMLYLGTTVAGLTSGNYIHCYDGAATDFIVAKYGATTIAGNAATTVFTVTVGDLVVSDGSLAITDADNAATLSVTNATLTTGTAVSLTFAGLTTGKGVSLTCDKATTGDILYIDAGGATLTTGYFINVNDDDVTYFGVGKGGATTITIPDNYGVEALTITQADATQNKDVIVTANAGTGNDLNLVNTNAGASGIVVKTNHDSASPADSDVIFRLSNYSDDAGANSTEMARIDTKVLDTTTASEDSEVSISAITNATLTQSAVFTGSAISVGSGAATGIVESDGNFDLQLQTGNSTTSTIVLTDGANGDITTTLNGTGQFILTSAGAIANGEAILIVSNTGTPAASGSSFIEIDATGVTATNHPTLLTLNSVGKDCIGINADVDGVTNDIYLFNAGGAIATGKSVLKVTADGTPAAADSLLVEFDYSGATMTNNPLAMLLKTKGTGGALTINQDGNGVGLTIDSEATTADLIVAEGVALTTGNGLYLNGFNALTTGSVIEVESDSADTTARNLVEIINENSAAVGAICLSIRNDAVSNTVNVDHNGITGSALVIDAEITTDNIVEIDCAALTTGNGLFMDGADALTTGSIARFESNSANTGIKSLVEIINTNSAAIGTQCLLVQQSAAKTAMQIDNNGAGVALNIDSETTAQSIVIIDGAVLSTGTGLFMNGYDTLTSGTIAEFESDSANTASRNLVEITNENAAAIGTICLNVRNDSTGATVTIDHNGITGPALSIDAEITTGNVIECDCAALTTGNGLFMEGADALTTGSIARFESDSSDTTARYLVEIINNNTAAVGTVPLFIQQDSPSTAHFYKVAVMAGISLWMGDGTTANSALSGTAGDILFNGGANKPEYCTGTTNWTALV